MSAYDIFLAFDQIGDVRNVEKSGGSGKQFTVSFADSKASNAKQAAVNANADGASEQPADQMAKRRRIDNSASTPNNSAQLLPMNVPADLIDGCWLQIFERLHVRDLYEVANVCKRFHGHAKHVFDAKYGHRQFRPHDLADDSRPSASLSLYVRAIRTFTPKKAYVPGVGQGNYNQDVVLQTIAEHCTNLEALYIGPQQLEPATLAALRPMLSRLKVLEIQSQHFPMDCDGAEWQTEVLYIRCIGEWPAPDIKLPKLTKLMIGSSNDDDESMFDFLARNPQIETLEFDCVDFKSGRLWSLAEYVPNVKSLAIDRCRTSMGYKPDRAVGVFKHLTHCSLYDCSRKSSKNVFMILLNRSAVKVLRLNVFHGNGFIEDICGLTTLTDLRLYCTILCREQMLKLVKAMAHLRSLNVTPMDVARWQHFPDYFARFQ